MAAKLNDAVKEGNIQVVQQLLAEGADINAKVERGWTPLHSAVQGDYNEIVELLLDKGANPFVKKDDGATPFILAGITGNEKLLQIFIEKGSDVNECGINGFTAFMEAAFYGQETALRFLFNNGANVNLGREVDESKKAVKKGGATALMDAARHGHITLVKILVKDMDANVNICDNRDTNALIHALSVAEDKGWDTNKEAVALFLLECEIDVNKRDEKGKTALILAVERGSLNLVKALLEIDEIDINDADESNTTALMVAVKKKNYEIAKLLCEKGAHVDNGLLDIANITYNIEMKRLLQKYCSSLPCPAQTETYMESSSGNWRLKLEKLKKMHRPMIGKLKIFQYQDLMIQRTTQGGVYLGIYDREEVAVKIFRKGSENADREKACLEKCRTSNHLVKFCGWEERKCCLYMCLTLCEKNLQEYFSEPEEGMMESKHILKTIFEAVMELHAFGFGHQELHPSNILIDINNRIFLADFDQSREITDDNKDVIISKDLQGLSKLTLYVVMRGEKVFKALPVHCPEELDDYVEIEDLQTRLESPDKNIPISDLLGQLIYHPYFWSKEKKYRVLRDVGNESDIKCKDDTSELLKALNSNDPFKDWKEKIDEEILDCMINLATEKGKKKKAGNNRQYKPCVTDLLKFIRNMGEHYSEKTDRVKFIMKDPAEYFLNLFPHLTIYIYQRLCNTEYSKHFNIATHP